MPTAVVERPELAFDLDLPSDILTVLESRREGRTLQVLPRPRTSGRGSPTTNPTER